MKFACLIIDMQNGFAHPDSHMGRSVGVKAQQAIIPVIGKLTELCRSRKIPLLWSKQEHFQEDATRARRKIRPHSAKQGFLPCLRGTWETEFEAGVRDFIHDGDHVVEKHRASVFYNTNLETKLRMLDVQVLLIAGCNTEFCVESTVRDAYARDFDVIVVRDAVAGIQPAFHEDSLKKIQAYFGEVMLLAELDPFLETL
jgi:ureidoacrylate peracid hydrolase